jgi:hypothetical protein
MHEIHVLVLNAGNPKKKCNKFKEKAEIMFRT